MSGFLAHVGAYQRQAHDLCDLLIGDCPAVAGSRYQFRMDEMVERRTAVLVFDDWHGEPSNGRRDLGLLATEREPPLQAAGLDRVDSDPPTIARPELGRAAAWTDHGGRYFQICSRCPDALSSEKRLLFLVRSNATATSPGASQKTAQVKCGPGVGLSLSTRGLIVIRIKPFGPVL